MSFDTKRIWGPTPRYPNVLEFDKNKNLRGMISISGPCSVESKEMIFGCAQELSRIQTSFLRGGIYRAGTYPPDTDFGLQRNRLHWLCDAGREFKIPVIAEVLDIRLIDYLDKYVDAFQVGARHCQDYALLAELSKTTKPVTLKRGMGMTLDEFLGAAEYLAKGNCKLILIERGSATHLNHVRWDISISLIAAIKRITTIPIIVDACHGSGRSDIVEPLTMAGLAAGADGYLIECHPNPSESTTDTDQAIDLSYMDSIKQRCATVWRNAQSCGRGCNNNDYVWDAHTIKKTRIQK